MTATAITIAATAGAATPELLIAPQATYGWPSYVTNRLRSRRLPPTNQPLRAAATGDQSCKKGFEQEGQKLQDVQNHVKDDALKAATDEPAAVRCCDRF